MYRRSFLLVSLVAVFAFMALGCANEPQRKPLGNEEDTTAYTTLLEEAVDNPHENGCVSCHKKTQEIDKSLATYVKRIAGHPAVKEGTVSACYECHEAQKDYELYKKFYQGMHQSHWLSETFYSKNEGDCYSCHTVEKNGISGIKDYPLAGYRDLEGKSGQGVKEESKATEQKQEPTPKQGLTSKQRPSQKQGPSQKQAPQQNQQLPEQNQEPTQNQQPEEEKLEEESDGGLPSDGSLKLVPIPGP